MKLITVSVKSIRRIKKDAYLLSVTSSYLAKRSLPGQFLHIKVGSFTLLRRPFSIHKVKNNNVFILFRVRGKGTQALSRYKEGNSLNILGPLGKGFEYKSQSHHVTKSQDKNGEWQILVAGGMGVAPLVFLAERLRKTRNTKHEARNLVLLGVKTRGEILCREDFKQLGFKVLVATEDGSVGFKGTAAGLLRSILDTRYSPAPCEQSEFTGVLDTRIYACGPKEMFLALAGTLKKYPQIKCQVSFEEFMGCGIGVCSACTIGTIKGYKKVCKDGPVFDLKEIKLKRGR